MRNGTRVTLAEGYLIFNSSIPAGAVGTVVGVTGSLVGVQFDDHAGVWGISPYDLTVVGA